MTAAMPLLVVDPWHWLDKDGYLLVDNPVLYRRMLRIARFIEYAGPLKKSLSQLGMTAFGFCLRKRALMPRLCLRRPALTPRSGKPRTSYRS